MIVNAFFIIVIYLYQNNIVSSIYTTSYNFSSLHDSGNYSCDIITRWLGSEKHYSNDKKEILFSFIRNNDDCYDHKPVIMMSDIYYGWSIGTNKRTYMRLSETSININQVDSANIDSHAVVYLSNFSINNNFSHFLHGILRLFCALVDAKWLQWDSSIETFVKTVDYTIWLDEFFKTNPTKMKWMETLGSKFRYLKDIQKPKYLIAKQMLYGSGCVRLLPPEKWFGYPGCRAKEMLPAFGYFLRKQFMGQTADDLKFIDSNAIEEHQKVGLRVAFSVRVVGPTTGRRAIKNLHDIQSLLRQTQHIKTSTENVTFESLDVSSTVRYMAGVHIFISVHGAGMTNMFFMNPGSAVVEVIPYPLCYCKSPDYFYGMGGYYHGTAISQGIRHYAYCVTEENTQWHKKPDGLHSGIRCSWKHLHAVESVTLDPDTFMSLLRLVERDLIANDIITLTRPVIQMSPHING